MGWTYRAWKAYSRKMAIAGFAIMGALFATRAISDSPWMRLGFFAVLILVSLPIIWLIRRQFIKSATPTDEQQAAFTAQEHATTKLGVVLSMIIVPAVLLSLFDEISQSLPEWFGSALILALLFAMALMIVVSRPLNRRFEDTLNWFDGSWS